MKQKKKRAGLTLGLALICGLASAFIAVKYLRNQTNVLAAAEPPSGQIAVATRPLPAGSVLRAEDVRLIDWPGGAQIPDGFAATTAEVVGRGVITPLALNEPILKAKLAGRDAGSGLPVLIPEGMRAVSVKVDEVIGVAGFVLPETRVDVLVTIEEDGREEDASITRVILQNVRTLAAGQSIQRDAEGKPQTVSVVTLLVTPEDGEKLVLAATEGRIQLALRNSLDTVERATSGARASGLVRGASSGTVARPVRSVPSSGGSRRAEDRGTVVETIRGGQRTLSTFSGGQ